MSLKHKASTAVFWSFVDRVFQYGFQALVSVLLARMLQPSEMGLIGMIWVFISILWIFNDIGLTPTLMQMKNATELDECSVFYFNIAMSACAVLAMWFTAPYIADFYNLPLLCPIARAVSFNMLFNAPGLIQSCILSKKLDLRTQAKTGMIGSSISGVVALTLAFNNFGVWSLVAQLLTQSLIRTAALWYFSSWRPKLKFSWNSIRGMLPFGLKVLFSAFINAIFDNLYPTAIGKLFSSFQLGLYTMGARMPQLFSGSLTTIISRVTIPIFPTLREKPVEFKAAFRRAMLLSMFVNTPILLGLVGIAPSLVSVVLTTKWLPAVPYLRLFCVVMLMMPYHQYALDAFLGLGDASLHLRVNLLHRILSLLNIISTYHLGIPSMLIGEVVVTLLTCFVAACVLARRITYPLCEQIRDIFPTSLAGVAMLIVVQLLTFLPLAGEAEKLIVQIAGGSCVFFGLCHIFSIEAYIDFVGMVRNFFNHRFIKLSSYSKSP